MATQAKTRIRPAAAAAAAMAALLLVSVFAFAAPAYASETYTQTQLGYQTVPVKLQKGAVRLDAQAGASYATVGLYAGVKADGTGTGSMAGAYMADPYAKVTKYANVAKTGTYYLVFYASESSGALGTTAKLTAYPYKNGTAKVGKTLTVSTCGDNSTIAYYKLKVKKRGQLSISVTDVTGYNGSVIHKLCNAKKKSLQGDYWTYTRNGETSYYGVKKGTYYLAVKSNLSVYKITPKLKAVTKAGGTSKSNAVKIAKGKAMTGVLATGEKSRWYKFTLSKAAKCKFTINGKSDDGGIRFTFSGAGYYDSSVTVWEGDPSKTMETTKLKPGTYYIEVTPASSGTRGSGWFSIKWK